MTVKASLGFVADTLALKGIFKALNPIKEILTQLGLHIGSLFTPRSDLPNDDTEQGKERRPRTSGGPVKP